MSDQNRTESGSGRRRWLLGLLAAGTQIVSGEALAQPIAGLRLIVHASNPQTSLSRDFVVDAFLKRATRWPHGESIFAVDLRSDSTVRRRFCEAVLKRSIGAVRSYWQQRIFSGRDVPPPELDTEEAVVSYVANYRGAIGYVSSDTKLVGVKEILMK
jgi:hypothetical protein